IEQGQLRQAEQLLTPLLAETRAAQLRLVLCDALQVLGLLATRQRRWQDAEEALAEALSLARSFPYPYGEAKILMWSGCLWLERHDRERSQQQFEAALAVLERLGERLYARRIELLRGGGAGEAGGEDHG